MSTIVSNIAGYLSRDVESLDVISQNVANMRTTGYRTARLRADFGVASGASAGHTLSLKDGSIDVTGGALDLAIEGNGFFVVSTEAGERLTRNGQLHVDAQGILVDSLGRQVLGDSGPIALDSGAVNIGNDGTISSAGQEVARLRIVGVASSDGLQALGDGLYAYSGTPADWNGSLHQGALERSNVDPGVEMVRLMELTRHAQSIQHALQAYDAAMQNGISHLGDNT